MELGIHQCYMSLNYININSDYTKGIKDGRYIYHELPKKMPVEDDYFDVGLSSHFLLMYTSLEYDFHIQALNEMLRVCKEIRIFPIVDLDANDTEITKRVINYYKGKYTLEIRNTGYEFQKGDNKMLIIKK